MATKNKAKPKAKRVSKKEMIGWMNDQCRSSYCVNYIFDGTCTASVECQCRQQREAIIAKLRAADDLLDLVKDYLNGVFVNEERGVADCPMGIVAKLRQSAERYEEA